MAKMRKLMVLLAAAAVALMIAPGTALAAGAEFTVQPQDVDVAYPEGVSFHVEVDRPEIVTSYQWVCSDGAKLFVLDGATASTDTLIVPSTVQNVNDLYYYCIIEDNQGHTTVSNPATLHITNAEENIPVLYVGEYALCPGDTLDLSETLMGEGIVEYDANGVDMTFTGIDYSNKYSVCDGTMAPSMGIMFYCRDDYELEYHFHFIGDCVFRDVYFDPEYNAAGVVFNSFFACSDDPNAPTMIIDGNCSLELIGGSTQLYSDANLEINVNLKTVPNGAVFCDGIRGNTVIIDEGAQVQLGVNGTAIHTEGDLRLEPGSRLDIISFGPHVSQGPTTKNIFFIRGSIYAKGTDVSIRAIGDAAQYHVYGAALAVWYGIYLTGDGSLNMDDSHMSITVESMRGIELFGVNFGGIQGEGPNCSVILENGSTLDIEVNAPDVMMGNGIYVCGIVSVDATSRLAVDAVSNGETFGIVAERALEVEDGELFVYVRSTDEMAKTYGVICGKADISIDGGGSVYIWAENGMALGADTGKHYEYGEPYESGWDPDYVAEHITLGGKAAFVTPADAGFSTLGVAQMGGTELVETVFDRADTSEPAAEILIMAETGTAGSGSEAGNGGAAGSEVGSGASAGSAGGSQAGSSANTGGFKGSGSWLLYVIGAAALLGIGVGCGRSSARKKEAQGAAAADEAPMAAAAEAAVEVADAESASEKAE